MALEKRIKFNDPGLTGKTGSFTAIDWSEKEKTENPLRHGFLRASANHHALNHADGTPYFAIGDTWYSMGANRFKWYDDTIERPIGPNAGFKDYVRYRKAQGYNWVNVIAAFPNWKTDDSSWHMGCTILQKQRYVQHGWSLVQAVQRIWIMKEAGPFSFPGKCRGMKIIFRI